MFFNIDVKLSHECRDAEKHIYFIDRKRLELKNVLESWQENFVVQIKLIMIFSNQTSETSLNCFFWQDFFFLRFNLEDSNFKRLQNFLISFSIVMNKHSMINRMLFQRIIEVFIVARVDDLAKCQTTQKIHWRQNDKTFNHLVVVKSRRKFIENNNKSWRFSWIFYNLFN